MWRKEPTYVGWCIKKKDKLSFRLTFLACDGVRNKHISDGKTPGDTAITSVINPLFEGQKRPICHQKELC